MQQMQQSITHKTLIGQGKVVECFLNYNEEYGFLNDQTIKCVTLIYPLNNSYILYLRYLVHKENIIKKLHRKAQASDSFCFTKNHIFLNVI